MYEKQGEHVKRNKEIKLDIFIERSYKSLNADIKLNPLNFTIDLFKLRSPDLICDIYLH